MSEREETSRDRLIAATRDLMWDRGYAAASPRVLLDRAGVGQGSMYHHFSGKEQLAAEAFAVTACDLLARARADLSAEGAGHRSAYDRITGYLLRKRDVLRGCPVGRMASDADVLDSAWLHGVLGETFEAVRGLVAGVIEEGVRTGELASDVNPLELADTVLAVVQGGYVLARAAGEAAPFDRAVHGAVALLALARTEVRT